MHSKKMVKRMKIPFVKALIILAVILVFPNMVVYADEAATEAHLVLANQAFEPQELRLPAGQKIKLIITNKDASNAEFESEKLNREKVVKAKAEIYVYFGPLKPGIYSFWDDFHPQTTRGEIIVE